MRKDGRFSAGVSEFNPYGETQPISFDFNIASQFNKPHFRSAPRISPIRPPVALPFDGTALNGLATGIGIVLGGVLLYYLGKDQKWWK